MPAPRAFCRAVMREYERQWARASGHAVRHPLRLKMEELRAWCVIDASVDEFEARLNEAERSSDVGMSLLAEELVPLWKQASADGRLPFDEG